MPFWQDESEAGYRMGVGVGLNPTNRQLPGLGGKSWNGPIVAGNASTVERLIAGLPVPDGELGDWDSPAEVIRNSASWLGTGNSQGATAASKSPLFWAAAAALGYLVLGKKLGLK